MPFQFRLKSLKKHREFKLDEAQAAFGAAMAERMRRLAECQHIMESIRGQTELFEQEQKNGIDVSRYVHFKNYLSNLERELLIAYKKLERAAKEAEKRKQAVIECDKSVKTLESIEVRDKVLYRLLESRKEQKKLDYVAVLSNFRNRD